MKHDTPYSRAEGVIQFSHPNAAVRRNAFILVLGFMSLILSGTVLLRLPLASTHQQLTWNEALFTSTSAVTLTGLNVITIAQDLSLFGQIVLLVLIEVGGIGFVTFSMLIFLLMGRRIGIAGRMLLRQSLGVFDTIGIGKLTLYMVSAILGLQAVGALLLWLRWGPTLGFDRAAYLAVFHSISAFCNAGFDLYSGVDSVLFGFDRDPFTLIVLMVLITIGALGLLVMIDLITYPWQRRLMVHTKLIVSLATLFTIFTVIMLLFDQAIAGADRGVFSAEAFWVALFKGVSARTAGITLLPISDVSEASKLVLLLLMFVGGAPASMSGGVTLSTVGVLFATLHTMVRGQPQVIIFRRTLPLETISKAVAIMTIATLLCFSATLLLLLGGAGSLLTVGFEVISAFSNTGFSLGVTNTLNGWQQLVIILMMFWGRLGPLTLVVLFVQRERPTLIRYPAEQIVLG